MHEFICSIFQVYIFHIYFQLYIHTYMGVESEGTGDASPAVEKSAGDVPREIVIFQYLFS